MTTELRASGTGTSYAMEGPWDPDNDGDDDSTPEGDTDHSHWDEDGQPIAAAWLADGQTPPEVPDSDDDGLPGSTDVGPHQAAGYSALNSKAPRDNLVRAWTGGVVELRAEGDTEPNVLYGHFSTFNDWYEVDSIWEGTFRERVLPGAFADTIKNDKASMRVLYDHGMDPALGNKPLGPIRVLKEDDKGAYFEVPLLQTDYNANFVVPALRGMLMDGTTAGSQLGSSFRFQVQEDQWKMNPKASKANPGGIPERSIVKARVFEFGPVTFPANAGATASARSVTDEWMARLATDSVFQRRFAERVGDKVAERVLTSIPDEIIKQPVRNRQAMLRRQARVLLALSA